MKTLAEWMEWVEERSTRDEDGCLIWKLCAPEGVPKAGGQEDGRKFNVNVRRTLWEAKHGKPAPTKWVVVCKCEKERCVEPECLKAVPRSTRTKGRPLSAAHKIAITRGRRSGKAVKLSDEAVNDIRSGDGTLREKAERYGIGVDHAREVLKQMRWRDLRNPFAGLMA